MSQTFQNRLSEEKIGMILIALLLLVAPPLFSMLISFILFIRYRKEFFLNIFYIFFVLFMTYQFAAYDTISRFFASDPSLESGFGQFFQEDFLLLTTRFFRKLGVEFFNVCYAFYLLALIFWVKAFKRCMDGMRWDVYLFIILISGITIREVLDLTYYSMALTVGLFWVSRQNLRWYDFLLMLPVLFLLHYGYLVVLLPSIPLYILLINKKWFVSACYVGIIIVLGFLFGNVTLPMLGIPIFDMLNETYELYTSDNFEWGASENVGGITVIIRDYFKIVLAAAVLIFSLKNIEKIKYKAILALNITSFALLPGFWSFRTFTERTMIVMTLTSILCLVMLWGKIPFRKNVKQLIAFLCAFFFVFSILKGTRLPMAKVFKAETYQNTRSRECYYPSALLFDYRHFGYSDAFIMENAFYK